MILCSFLQQGAKAQTSVSSLAKLLQCGQSTTWKNVHCMHRTNTKQLPSVVMRNRCTGFSSSFNGQVAKV